MNTKEKILALKMKFDGCTISQIAEELRVSKSTAQAAVQTYQFELSWLLETVKQLERHNEELFHAHKTLILTIARKINAYLGGIGYTKVSKTDLQALIDEALDLYNYILRISRDYELTCVELETTVKNYITLLHIEFDRAEKRGFEIYLDDLKKASLLPTQEVQSWEK